MKIFTKRRVLVGYLLVLFAAGWGGDGIKTVYTVWKNYQAQRESQAQMEQRQREREREEARRAQQKSEAPAEAPIKPQVSERELEKQREREELEKIQATIQDLEGKNQGLISDIQNFNNNLEFIDGQPVEIDSLRQPACHTVTACTEIQRRIEAQISNNSRARDDAKLRIETIKNKKRSSDGLKIKTDELKTLINKNAELVKKIYALQPVAKKSYEDAMAAGRDVSFVTAVFNGVNAQELDNPDSCARSPNCFDYAKSAFAEAISTNEKIISNAELMIQKLNAGVSK